MWLQKKGIPCGVGCRCTGCENHEHHHEARDVEHHHEARDAESDSNTEGSASESDTEEQNEYETLMHVNKIINEVFGQWNWEIAAEENVIIGKEYGEDRYQAHPDATALSISLFIDKAIFFVFPT